MATFIKKDAGNPEETAKLFNKLTDVGSISNNTDTNGEAVAEELEDKKTLTRKLLDLDDKEYKGFYELYVAADLNLNEKKYLSNLLDNNKEEDAYNYLLSKQSYIEED